MFNRRKIVTRITPTKIANRFEFYSTGYGTYWLLKEPDGYVTVLTGATERVASTPAREKVLKRAIKAGWPD